MARGSLQFVSCVQRHISGLKSASYVMTDIYGTCELMLRAHGKSQTCSFLLCSLYSMHLSCLNGHPSIFPGRGNGKRRPAATVRCSLHTPFNRSMSCFEIQVKDSTSDLKSKSIW